MSAKTLAALYDGGIPLFFGLYITLLAFRVIGKPPGVNPRFDAWRARYGPSMKWLGFALILFGVYQVMRVLLASS